MVCCLKSKKPNESTAPRLKGSVQGTVTTLQPAQDDIISVAAPSVTGDAKQNPAMEIVSEAPDNDSEAPEPGVEHFEEEPVAGAAPGVVKMSQAGFDFAMADPKFGFVIKKEGEQKRDNVPVFLDNESTVVGSPLGQDLSPVSLYPETPFSAALKNGKFLATTGDGDDDVQIHVADEPGIVKIPIDFKRTLNGKRRGPGSLLSSLKDVKSMLDSTLFQTKFEPGDEDTILEEDVKTNEDDIGLDHYKTIVSEDNVVVEIPKEENKNVDINKQKNNFGTNMSSHSMNVDNESQTSDYIPEDVEKFEEIVEEIQEEIEIDSDDIPFEDQEISGLNRNNAEQVKRYQEALKTMMEIPEWKIAYEDRSLDNLSHLRIDLKEDRYSGEAFNVSVIQGKAVDAMAPIFEMQTWPDWFPGCSKCDFTGTTKLWEFQCHFEQKLMMGAFKLDQNTKTERWINRTRGFYLHSVRPLEKGEDGYVEPRFNRIPMYGSMMLISPTPGETIVVTRFSFEAPFRIPKPVESLFIGAIAPKIAKSLYDNTQLASDPDHKFMGLIKKDATGFYSHLSELMKPDHARPKKIIKLIYGIFDDIKPMPHIPKSKIMRVKKVVKKIRISRESTRNLKRKTLDTARKNARSIKSKLNMLSSTGSKQFLDVQKAEIDEEFDSGLAADEGDVVPSQNVARLSFDSALAPLGEMSFDSIPRNEVIDGLNRDDPADIKMYLQALNLVSEVPQWRVAYEDKNPLNPVHLRIVMNDDRYSGEAYNVSSIQGTLCDVMAPIIEIDSWTDWFPGCVKHEFVGECSALKFQSHFEQKLAFGAFKIDQNSRTRRFINKSRGFYLQHITTLQPGDDGYVEPRWSRNPIEGACLGIQKNDKETIILQRFTFGAPFKIPGFIENLFCDVVAPKIGRAMSENALLSKDPKQPFMKRIEEDQKGMYAYLKHLQDPKTPRPHNLISTVNGLFGIETKDETVRNSKMNSVRRESGGRNSRRASRRV